MAEVLGALTWKTVGETVAGELFRTKLGGGYAICVTLLAKTNGDPVIGVLECAREELPVHHVLQKQQSCISYGTQWALDPTWDQESIERNTKLEDTVRVIWFDGNGAAVMNFYRPGSKDDFDTMDADLLGGGLLNRDENAIPVRRWKIWASADDRNRPGAEPVLSFGD